MGSRFTGLGGALLLLSCAGFAAQAQEKPQTEPPPLEKAKQIENLAPDIKAEALWDGRKMAPFKALDNPKMVKAAAVNFLDDKDYVLGLNINGESRAYPTRFIWWHHIINDRAGLPEAGG